MSVLKISVEDADTEKLELFLQSYGNKAKSAVCKSLNRAANGVKTDAAKEARTVYNVKATAVKKTCKLFKATHSNLDASAVFTGEGIPLYAFAPKSSKPNVYVKAGITVKVKAARKKVRGGFVARMPSGHVGVFKRTGKFGRRKIEELEKFRELKSTSIPQMLNNPKVKSALQVKAAQRFTKNLDHEMDYLMSKGGK
ncbi:phage tail protein [Desulfoluna butyratoxydans]|uniref:Bacteriophage lambda gpz minor tail n=1 Tax=Desulfoluna butyratoxydans TaxID=231438 RepID=A0A4U8YSM3_9BACT|nr:phage tail protein [Desulfoluna butyratoxydans]VFQ46911.1 bacteriophage lambda gpz minor tail [Desulfoluna butyratoxydans]